MWTFLSDFYYTNLFNGVVITLVVTLGIIFYNKLNNLKLLFWYCIISFFQATIALILAFLYNEDSYPKINFTINIFVLFEFLIFHLFIYFNISNKTAKKIIFIIIISFILTTFIFWFICNSIFQNPTTLSIIESFSIITFSLYYIYEKLAFYHFHEVANRPTFWVITGVFLLFTIMTPLLLLNEFFPSLLFKEIYTINNISYILFYLILSYSFICKVKSIT